MPWKPPAVGDKYDGKWQTIRKSVLQMEPLCRLCLAAGRTTAACVVDHIVPLKDGGTHAESNLQPMCKRCHDSIKTPADTADRNRSNARGICTILLVPPLPSSVGVATVDTLAMRNALMTRLPLTMAHTVSLAAAEGILQCWFRGDIDRDISIQMDCDQSADLWHSRYGAIVKKVPMDESQIRRLRSDVPDFMRAWLLERESRQRSRSINTTKLGSQQERVPFIG